MRAADCDVVVRDVGVDAALADSGDGRPLLILRPLMSRGAAVQAVMGVLPSLPADEAARIVRQALPTAPDLDDVLVRPMDPSEGRVAERPSRVFGGPLVTAAMCAASAVVAAGAVAAVHHTAPPAVVPVGDVETVSVMPLDGDSGKRVCVAGGVAWRCNPPAGIGTLRTRVDRELIEAHRAQRGAADAPVSVEHLEPVRPGATVKPDGGTASSPPTPSPAPVPVATAPTTAPAPAAPAPVPALPAAEKPVVPTPTLSLAPEPTALPEVLPDVPEALDGLHATADALVGAVVP